LADSSNYNLRFDGPEVMSRIGWGSIGLADLDGDGKQDIIFTSLDSYNGHNTSCSLYVIYNTLIDNYPGTGNTLNLADSSNYNLRFDGANIGDNDNWLGDIALTTGDLDNDGKKDLIMGGPRINGGASGEKTNSGAFYVVYNSLINNYSGTGNNIDLADSSNYSLKYDGGTAYDHLAIRNIKPTDLNGDGREDLIFTAHLTDYNSRTDSGSLYIIYNFPHTFSVSSLSKDIIREGNIILNGTVTASNSVTNIAKVQYSLDNNDNSLSSWHDCLADDGAFDSKEESFSCSISSVSEGHHNVYIRAYDVNQSYTASSQMRQVSFTYDKTAPEVKWEIRPGVEKEFGTNQPTAISHTDQQLPTFTFTRSHDSTTGIAKYQILITDEEGNGRVYIDNIDPNSPTNDVNSKNIREDDDKWVSYDLKEETISVRSKKDEDKLEPGAYRWKVRVIDKAGNIQDSDEKILMIKTHQINFSGQFFPLAILNLGGVTTNITSLDLSTIPQEGLVVREKRPIIYGITNTGARVKLKLTDSNGY